MVPTIRLLCVQVVLLCSTAANARSIQESWEMVDSRSRDDQPPTGMRGVLKSDASQGIRVESADSTHEIKLSIDPSWPIKTTDDDDGVKKSSSKLHVIIIYSLVILTVVIKTAPNVVYYIVYKMEKQPSKKGTEFEFKREGIVEVDGGLSDFGIKHEDFWWPRFVILSN